MTACMCASCPLFRPISFQKMRELYILCLEDSWGFQKSSEEVLRSTSMGLLSIKGLEGFLYYVFLH
jgi:hypothetical protein